MSTEAAFAFWPQLRDAVQPAPIQRQSFKGAFRVAAEWAQLVQRVERGEFRLRSGAASPAGLCGPIVGRGPCLDPVFVDGDCYWIDPHCEARDGDFVMLQWHREKLRGIVERGRSKPEWLAEYGENPDDTALKWLRTSRTNGQRPSSRPSSVRRRQSGLGTVSKHWNARRRAPCVNCSSTRTTRRRSNGSPRSRPRSRGCAAS
jgi:hypothetical protein